MDCDKAIEGTYRVAFHARVVRESVESGDSTSALKEIRRIRELCDELEKEVTTFDQRPAAAEP
jgi:hypothetical protein